MSRRMRAGLVLAVILVMVAGVGACDAGEMAADAMVDAAALLRDGASDDAAAQPPGDVISMEVPCDVVREETWTDEYADGIVGPGDTTGWRRRWINSYAELRDNSFQASSVRVLSAIGCGYEEAGLPPQCTLSGGEGTTACDGEPPFPPLSCRSMLPQIDDGIIRVWCGTRVERARRGLDGSWGEWGQESVWGVSTVRITVQMQ